MKTFKASFGPRLKINPPLAIFSNPARGRSRKGDLMGLEVYGLEYRHVEDGENYRHEFSDPVVMRALPNGDILLTRQRAEDGPVWEEF